MSDSQNFLDEEAIVINSASFGVKTEDEKYAIENNGLTSRLFLQENGSNKYKLKGQYDDNTVFGSTRHGLKYSYAQRLGWLSRKWNDESNGLEVSVLNSAPVYLDTSLPVRRRSHATNRY